MGIKTNKLEATQQITCPTPINNTDAANKSYVDAHLTTRTVLWGGGASASNVAIRDIRNFKYLILYLKVGDEWLTCTYEANFIADEYLGGFNPKLLVQNNTPDTYKYVSVTFNSSSSININMLNAAYVYFVGIN